MNESVDLECPSCGATNRVSAEKVGNGAIVVCGRCKTQLTAHAAAPMTGTDSNFASLVENSPVPVLVDLWAPWCGPCRTLAPILDEVARDLSGRVRVVKVNVDQNPQTSSRFQVRGIPALLIFKSGREIDRMVGLQPKAAILQHLQRAIA